MKEISPHESLYDTEEWYKTRNKVYLKAGYKCNRCGISHMGLNAHHFSYDKDFFDLNNLICLCDKCHYHIHPDKDGVKNKYIKRKEINLDFFTVKDFILKRDGRKCVNCGEEYNIMMIQQIVDRPFRRDELDNLVCVCEKCQTNLFQNDYLIKIREYRDILKEERIEKQKLDAKNVGMIDEWYRWKESDSLDWNLLNKANSIDEILSILRNNKTRCEILHRD